MSSDLLYFNLYTLQKIADFLGFKFDRTRSARTVLEDSVKRGESQKILDDKGVTHYSLTKNGLKSSQTRLLELYEITSSKLLPLAKKSSKERFTMKFMTSISHPSPSLHPEVQKLIDRMKSIERPLNII